MKKYYEMRIEFMRNLELYRATKDLVYRNVAENLYSRMTAYLLKMEEDGDTSYKE